MQQSFKLLSGLATPDGSRLVFLADIVRDNATRDDLGWCRGTMAVAVANPLSPPEQWRYQMAKVPHTTPDCSGLNWFAAMAWAAPDTPAGGAEDAVYVLGIRGDQPGDKQQVRPAASNLSVAFLRKGRHGRDR